ncbi:MAG TPA: efflux RND transporter periplasmic adaptor subunit [Fibrobacteria bacterium]|nr:efflux RND transporter periplasmic adaptor subunit [Fibrobacteria bacterium]
MKITRTMLLVGVALGALSGCRDEHERPDAAPRRLAGSVLVVRDTLVESMLEATGAAAPRLSADLSTRLMGKILSVSVKEGDRVRAGQFLLQVDGKDLDARSDGLVSGLEASRSQLALAETQVRRMRSLFADSAVPRSALDQAEAELDRARAGLSQVRAQDAELKSIQGYSRIVAPFSGKIVSRLVDPGMMASPGAPLLRMEDASVLRISVSTTTATARNLSVGTVLVARVDGRDVRARIEGIVPSGSGNLSVVNAIVDNGADSLSSGAVATLFLPRGKRMARLVPESGLVRQGDLVGVWVRGPQGDVKRWIRTGARMDGRVEVLSGLAEGDSVVVPSLAVAGN